MSFLIAVGFGVVLGLGFVFAFWGAFLKFRAVVLELKRALEAKPDMAAINSLIDLRLGKSTLGLLQQDAALPAAAPPTDPVPGKLDELRDLVKNLGDHAQHQTSMAAEHTQSIGAVSKTAYEAHHRLTDLDKEVDSLYRRLDEFRVSLTDADKRSIKRGELKPIRKDVAKLQSQVKQLGEAVDGIVGVIRQRLAAAAPPPAPPPASPAAAANAN